MRLTYRLLIISVLAALPVAGLTVLAVSRYQARDARETLDRIASSFLTHHVRTACEADPGWFLAGPRGAPPSLEERRQPDAETRLPRPSTEELPIEYYAYNEQFQAMSTAAPRFPPDLRAALRSIDPVSSIQAPFDSPAGEGLQLARLTGWNPGPCAVLLFRWRPLPGQGAGWLFAGVFLGTFLAGLVVGGPIVLRIQRLSRAAQESAKQDYRGLVPASRGDEIGWLGATFNETGVDIRRRITDSIEREEALRRYVADVTEGVAAPLADLEARLVAAAAGQPAATDLVRRAHELSSRLLNLAAVARLRTTRDRLTREPVDMNAVVTRVVAAAAPLAKAMGVTVTTALPATPAVIAGDPVLFERAIANLVDNAILYNQTGGRVAIEVARYEGHGRFSLRVTDTGRGVSDEEFTGLTAIRRFRGDEGRDRRAGVPGLGLAVAREVAERFDFGLELRRPAAGGFEAEFAGAGSRLGTAAPDL